jgi:hypothetical protein
MADEISFVHFNFDVYKYGGGGGQKCEEIFGKHSPNFIFS